ncbi:MAG: hypothetical protein C0504_07540 [Candidatus Solibacter sp.]|nr:hypothetical protein [Candidatus Solibacter sp.]
MSGDLELSAAVRTHARVEVWIDGAPAAEFDQLPKALLEAGRIGLQFRSDKATVEFRDIRVRAIVP